MINNKINKKSHGKNRCGSKYCKGKLCQTNGQAKTTLEILQNEKIELELEVKKHSHELATIKVYKQSMEGEKFFGRYIVPHGLLPLKKQIDELRDMNRNPEMYGIYYLSDYKKNISEDSAAFIGISKTSLEYEAISYLNPDYSDSEIRKAILYERKVQEVGFNIEHFICLSHGVVISIANRYKAVALSLEKIKDQLQLDPNVKLDLTKKIAKHVGGFSLDVFYVANAVRHSQEWYEEFRRYREKYPGARIDLSNKIELKNIFKEMGHSSGVQPAESIAHLNQLLASKGITLKVEQFNEEIICRFLPNILKIHNYELMEEEFKKYKDAVNKILPS